MPVTQSAKKALRRDQRRTVINKKIKRGLKQAVKQARQKPTKKNLAVAASILDRAAKKKIIHPNKAARSKSRLASLFTKRA
ncbi:30S ribosomal protein S20 [Candidatus Shapirobacteria bacterium CG10_big_fil_rev_8_21_14_0_10_48_15]|uniref:Small ribosomal subunit protein bS20 n=1 Tax=Candidatus Shapirobacteria bacterium CG10_big_fil_rev_8_21_14_0_10_48_15 TaxID=1974484 RepID=A0A2M8L7B7_9BACT|nr:MAG: 30S ribosomal protein S20 [Candidatus Shapirobacteria bacterium CG10_big_fil_rev_8_21_14_0_10_48_15]